VETLLLWLVVLVALGFDFVNGFHDAANSIATIVSTRVLSPRWAVVWAATFNFVAFLIFGTHVADTIAKDVVTQDVLSIGVIFSGLVGAISLNLMTFFLGLPTSSSHALVGGIGGAAVAKAGTHVLVVEGIRKIAVFIVLSPLLGLALAFVVFTLVMWIFHRYRKVDRPQPRVPAAPARVGRGLQHRPRRQTTPRRRWHHPRPAHRGRPPPQGRRRPAVGGARRAHRHRRRHPLGRLEDRQDHGLEDHPAPARRRLRRGERGPPPRSSSCRPPAFRCPPPTHTITVAIIGVGTAHRVSAVRWGVAGRVVLGVGADHPHRGPHRGRDLPRGGRVLMDRRALFFLGAAVVSAALYPATDPEHRWVCVALAIVYTVLAAGSALDTRSRHRRHPRRGDRT